MCDVVSWLSATSHVTLFGAVLPYWDKYIYIYIQLNDPIDPPLEPEPPPCLSPAISATSALPLPWMFPTMRRAIMLLSWVGALMKRYAVPTNPL